MSRSWSWIALIAAPSSNGIATVPATARQLRTSDQTDPRKWGRRKPSMRTKLLTGAQAYFSK